MVRAFGHGAISHPSQCSTTGVTKAMVCVILWDDAYKRTLAANHVVTVGFLSHCLNGPLPYI